MTGLISCTMECNLACKYCFEGNGEVKCYPDTRKINHKFMKSKNEIIKFIDSLYEYNGQQKTSIIWHGGEPTLIKPELMDIIMQDQIDKNHSNISWGIQTNGTIITDNHIEVFKKHNVGVGISLDGLKEHHDINRVTKNGKPTFDIIDNNIKKLIKNNVKCGVLVTITNDNVNDLQRIYDYLADKNLSFNFNALYPIEQDSKNDLNVELFSKRICELFDRWISDDKHKIIIGPFLQIIEGILKPERGIPACNWQKNCGQSFVAINTDGELYPCEHWVNNKEMNFLDIINLSECNQLKSDFFDKRVEILRENDCKDCSIFEFCYGGCPWNAMVLNGDVMKKDSSICDGRKKIISHIYNYLKLHKNDKVRTLHL